MDKWAYKTLTFEKGRGYLPNEEVFKERLNGYGAQGWEAVSRFDANQACGAVRCVYVWLKRRLEA
jgi:hypothetical protein